jgi:ABC-2 type transport system permease protein
MRNALRLYLRYAGISFRAQMQYRASFVMQSVGQFVITGIEFLGVWALFDRFGALPGWSLAEVAVLYGMANVAWALCDALSRGFDAFGNLVRNGDFDRMLLRPRSTVLQVTGHEFTLRRVGRFAQGAAVLVWGSWAAGVDWTPGKVALLLAAVLGGACMFFGVIIIQAVMAIWTTEPLEIMNAVTYGGVYATQYPLSIYGTWFRRFFTFIVPLAFVNYVPSLAILGHAGTAWPCYLSPLAGVAFLLVALRIWRFGIRHYCSTGS